MQKKGLQKGGSLKFVSEVKSLNFKQYGVSHKILSSKKIKIAGVSGKITVNGLKQFLNENLDYANAKLLNTLKGYYVQFTTYTDKNKILKKESNKKILGIDFGCETGGRTKLQMKALVDSALECAVGNDESTNC